MKLAHLVSAFTSWGALVQSQRSVTVSNTDYDVKYVGFERNGIEAFLNIRYAEDTSGANRFKPPIPFKPEAGETYDATKAGPACPQSLGQWFPPLTLGNVTAVSEDCLGLNVARPKMEDLGGYGKGKKLPVMVWIHGGSFWVGSKDEPTHMPDGLVLQSIKNGLPVIHVAINYRLGFFGFAQSDALKEEGSENAGLRDQRLAMEWVKNSITYFGGDPENITIFGQSSGGLAVGLQLLAYGGTKPLPFQQGICESQALEPGITGNFTIDAMKLLVDYVGCNATDLHAPETIACLRKFDTQTLFNASFDTYVGDINHNIGDIWLPVVDGDFLPAAPSQLVKEGKFGNATYMIGWTDGDVNFFTDASIVTANDTYNFIQGYLPAAPESAVNKLLDLYPVEEFGPPRTTNLTAEFYRAARVFRDIIMVCQPLYLAEHMFAKHQKESPSSANGNVYLYDFNQTILEPIIAQVSNISDIGVVHTSEFAYIYGNFSHWNVSGYPLNPKPEDYALLERASRSWSTFASTGNPVKKGATTLQGWKHAFVKEDNVGIMVIGGPNEGFSFVDGEGSSGEIKGQRLRERCSVINSEEFIGWLKY